MYYMVIQKISMILKLLICLKFNLFNEGKSYDLDSVVDNKSLSSGQMQKVGFIRFSYLIQKFYYWMSQWQIR